MTVIDSLAEDDAGLTLSWNNQSAAVQDAFYVYIVSAIGERLVVADGAVHKHIRSIFAELDLPPDDSADRRVTAVRRYLDTSGWAPPPPGEGAAPVSCRSQRRRRPRRRRRPGDRWAGR
ncbi:hypothetical protein O2W15_10935 [Modestobacter sp. VKM Ac-2979]|uniref:hypothetical protein n=1 Tax=unclassified Modestobacter TaxID=2643866 RepID=UPI0022ABA0F0|nr:MULTISPECIES: hypothetical protein [unclassified Modestobacter]MCZ2811951.1 hypothetical protein [Modestobacter sp. VKM Ac-2979]MCZ2843674.1 hypothetical protein [Modestobacter sp. VKM Ac-2980]